VTLDEIVARRMRFLTDYQDEAYARRYGALVERVLRAETERTPGRAGFAEAVARSYFRLLAYKDEYEVARLYTDGSFMRQLRDQFEGDWRLEFHLAPPLLSSIDPETGRPRKRSFGPWMLKAFRLLASLRHLRGTRLDLFGYSAERKMERRLIADYERTVEELLAQLDRERHTVAVEIARLPEQIRGFGPIKAANLERARAREAELLAAFRAPAPQKTAAE
jgi:indolepyruvate ferredoxin oxidoreductase